MVAIDRKALHHTIDLIGDALLLIVPWGFFMTCAVYSVMHDSYPKKWPSCPSFALLQYDDMCLFAAVTALTLAVFGVLRLFLHWHIRWSALLAIVSGVIAAVASLSLSNA